VGGGGKDRNIYRCHSCDKAGNPFCSIAETTVMSELEELVRMLYSERNLRKMVKATQSDDDGDVNRHANRIEAAIIQVERERDRVIYAYQNGVIEHDDLEKRLRPLNERREELRRQLSTLQASIGAVETYQERLDRLRDAVSRFGDMLEQMSTPEANRLLRRNFRIYIRPRTVERIEIL
jgi:DNA repair exonuclease SbcCD ATPase subunit